MDNYNTLALANGANNNVTLLAGRSQVTGPGAAFSITGIVALAQGTVVELYSPDSLSAFAITSNSASSSAPNRILFLDNTKSDNSGNLNGVIFTKLVYIGANWYVVDFEQQNSDRFWAGANVGGVTMSIYNSAANVAGVGLTIRAQGPASGNANGGGTTITGGIAAGTGITGSGTISDGAQQNFITCGGSIGQEVQIYANNIKQILTNGTVNSVQFGVTESFGGGNGVIGVSAMTTAPTTNPASSGIVLWSQSGGLNVRGSGGQTTWVTPFITGATNTQAQGVVSMLMETRTSAGGAAVIGSYGLTVAFAANTVFNFVVELTSKDTANFANSAGARMTGSFVNNNGTVVQLGSTEVVNQGYTTPPTLNISGTSIQVKATPQTTNNTDHQALVTVIGN